MQFMTYVMIQFAPAGVRRSAQAYRLPFRQISRDKPVRVFVRLWSIPHIVSTRIIIHTSRIKKFYNSTSLCRMWQLWIYGCYWLQLRRPLCVCRWLMILLTSRSQILNLRRVLYWSITKLRAGYSWIRYYTVDNLLIKIAEWDYAGQSYCIQSYYVTGLESFAAALYREAFPCVKSCWNGDGPALRILALLPWSGIDGQHT